MFARLREGGTRLIAASGSENAHLEFRVDAMYAGQRSELEALVDPTHPEPLAHLKEAFGEAHRRQFGYSLPAEVYVSTLRTRAIEAAAREILPPELEAREEGSPSGARDIVIAGERHEGVPVFDSAALAPGQRIAGPAIIEAPSYTAVFGPGDEAEINSVGDIVVEIQEV
jgi:N-methylhydantoinase A